MKFLGLNFGMTVGPFAVGAAAVLFGPQLLAATGSILKSVVKAGIKGGLTAYEGGRQLLSDAKGGLEDIATEAKDETIKRRKAQAAKKEAKSLPAVRQA